MIEKYFLVPAKDPWNAHVVEIDDDDLLSGIREAINCNYIEIAQMRSIMSPPEGVIMIVDEEGWIRTAPTENMLATFLCMVPIAGNVLFGRRGYRDGEPDIVGLLDSDIEFFKYNLDI